MFALIVLVVVYGLLMLIDLIGRCPAALRSQPARVRLALATMFLLGSSTRLFSAEMLMQMVPSWLPWRREAVYVSGLCEALGAGGMLVPQTRRPAGLGLALLLALIYPANVNVAIQNLQIKGYPSSPLYQWARLPVQPLLIWLVLWASRSDDAP